VKRREIDRVTSKPWVIELENPGADLITTIYGKFYWCPSQNDQRTWNDDVFILLPWFGFYEPKNQSLCKPLQGCEGHTINLFECSGQWPVANIQVWQIRSFHLFNKMTLLLASFSWPSCNNDRLKESWYKLEGVTEVCNVKVSWMNNSWEIKMPMTGTFLSCI
jgi:hypothetical protein